MITRDITFTVLLYCEVPQQEEASCITWRYPFTGTSHREAITWLKGILLLASRGGETTTSRSALRSGETSLPTRPEKRQKSMPAPCCLKDLLEK